MLNVLAIAKPEPRENETRPWFVVEPGELYPAALAHVALVVKNGARPPDPLGLLFDQARQLPTNALTELALIPFSEVGNSQKTRTARATALEIARLWFTELLQTTVGGPIGLHILKNEDWKL